MRAAAGRERRDTVPLEAHAELVVPDDPTSALAILQAEDANRLQDLVPIRYGRMLATPFTFLRGSAAVMATDLAAGRKTGRGDRPSSFGPIASSKSPIRGIHANAQRPRRPSSGRSESRQSGAHGAPTVGVDCGQIRRRRPRPGVTTAPTTAAFATGEGPGVTALVTTAALATGAPTTPTRPLRPGPTGMSSSLCFECFVRLDGGDDGLGGDTAVRNELSTGASRS